MPKNEIRNLVNKTRVYNFVHPFVVDKEFEKI